MNKILSVVAAVALLFTACESANEGSGAGDKQIKLISNEVVKVGSNDSIAFLEYEILDMVAGAEVKAYTNVDWIGSFDYKQQGKIIFWVDKNPDDEPREGVITITYDKSQLEVKVIQQLNENPTNKDIQVKLLQGKYYGNVQGLYNYYLVFSDLGMDSNNLFSTPNARYYIADLYLEVEPSDMNNITVPVGVYSYDSNNQPIGGSFKQQFSWYQVNDESGAVASQTRYEDGMLTIEDGKVTFKVTLEIDDIEETHTVIYEGDYSLLDCVDENVGY